MNIKDEQQPQIFYLVILLLVLVAIAGFLFGLGTGASINVGDIQIMEVEETDPTENTIPMAGMPLKKGEGASAKNEAVTEPVRSSGALAFDPMANLIFNGYGNEPANAIGEVSKPSIKNTKPVQEPTVDPQDLEMLACVIYQEAGGDAACDDCRRRVADVVLNRVASPYFPNTIYEVLTQESQYGRLHWTGIVWPERAKNPYEAAAVERAYRIAEEVLKGNHSELYGENYIWQAEFVQGYDIVYCCGHYFGR